MKTLMALLFILFFGYSTIGRAGEARVRVVGIVKKLDGDAVVLRVKDRNIRLSKRFFEDRFNLSEGEMATAHYTMTFKENSSRNSSSN